MKHVVPSMTLGLFSCPKCHYTADLRSARCGARSLMEETGLDYDAVDNNALQPS